jgi:hypothetical protein
LLCKNSVKTFPRQRRIVGGVVFYAVLDASKESRRLVLPRISCSESVYQHLLAISVRFLEILIINNGKRTLGRPRLRWMDNIKMDFRVIRWYGKDWIDLAQDRDQWRALVNTVMNLRDPKCWEVLE